MHFRNKEEKSLKAVNETKYKDNQTLLKDKPLINLPQKQFEKRKSILTELYEDNVHTRAVFNIIIGFSLSVITALTLKEYVYHESPSPFYLLNEKFAKLHLVTLIWLINNLIIFVCYYAYAVWEKIRKNCCLLVNWFLKDKNGILQIGGENTLISSVNGTQVSKTYYWDRLCLTLLVIYYLLTFYVTPCAISYFKLPFASALIILGESTRLLMKLHAFVRSNTPKVLMCTSLKTLSTPSFQKFLYFLYAPTLLYRDDYPRSEPTRWRFVFYRLLDIFGIIVGLAFLFEHFVKPIFGDACKTPLTIPQFMVLVLKGGVISSVILCLLFAAAIHSIQNALGEILNFGDRMFHSDWWNCTDMAEFYRKWNWVVGDWLYTYVHKDIIETFRPRQKFIPKIATIVVSALAHEYICTVGTGFFCPIISAMMFISILLPSIKVNNNKNFNRIVALALYTIGTGIMGTFLFAEYFARKNIPSSNALSVFWSNNCVRY